MDSVTGALQGGTGIPAAVWSTAGQNDVDNGELAFLTASDILSFSLGSTELLGLGSSVLHLKVPPREKLGARNAADFARLVQRLAEVRLIDLSETNNSGVQNDLVSIIAEHCTALTSLNVSFCYGVGDASFTAIAEHSTALTSLDLSGCNELTDASITTIAEHCSALTSLKVYGCNKLTDASFTARKERQLLS